MLGKPQFTNKIVSEKLDIPEETVSSVVTFFFDELYQEMGRARYPFIYVRDLGTFTLVIASIESHIKRYWRARRNMLKMGTPWKYENKLLALRRELFILFEMRRLIKNQRNEIKKLRNERKASDDNKG